ncbi:sensor domain-containing protein [Bacillus sp. Marseille-P3661]|uniref:sensor domain-containing protein n=1 Tax=Bacillus sp. Marseille-P3661 TaxID=1936234 RepID=UPI000C819739|nr:EAL domain-containing protein [Bacillus sp. Marseille-P3661]
MSNFDKHQKKLEISSDNRGVLYQKLFETHSVPIYIIDQNGKYLDYNKGFENLTGYGPKELIGQGYEMIIHPSDLIAVESFFKSSLLGDTHTREFRIIHKNGGIKTVSTDAVPITSSNREDQGIFVIGKDITEQKRAQQAAEYMAYHDFLSDLPNRRLFEETLDKEIKYATENTSCLAVLFIDVDRLKFVNDTLGHDIGDKVLKKVASTLKLCVTSKDLVARWAGDEFIILLTKLDDAHGAEQIAQKIIQSFNEPYIIDNLELYMTVSIGISIFPESGQDLNSLIKSANLAMYLIKENGKNNFQLYYPRLNTHTFRTFSLQNDLRKALANNQFELYYQPKVNAITRRIIGAEALIRWNHPELGIVPPNDFIPLAEEFGFIIPIGDWVLKNVCYQIRQWEGEGIEPIPVCINFSVIQFLQQDFIGKFAATLKEYNIEGKMIEVEITESMILDREYEMVKTFESLKKLGVHLALDDFGTGYSSLSYLRKYKFDTIKLDRSFVKDIHSNLESASIIKFITILCKELDMIIVAEGVEEEKQLISLRDLKCDVLQGYLFSKPKPINEFKTLLINKYC